MTIWSCDEKKKNGKILQCRNPHGCHCREIDDLSAEIERLAASIKDCADGGPCAKAAMSAADRGSQS